MNKHIIWPNRLLLSLCLPLAISTTAHAQVYVVTNSGSPYTTATGNLALANNNNNLGLSNTANGLQSLRWNGSGSNNTAIGFNALYSNTSANSNTASGSRTLYYNTTGINNTGNGDHALYTNSVGNNNTAHGAFALLNSTGSNNLALGNRAGYNLTLGSDNINIGHEGLAGESQTMRIGTQGTQTSTYIAGIYGATVTGGAVYVNANGQLGVLPSSGRYKKDIQSLGETSQKILSLRPVTFRYKHADGKGGYPLQYGLIAEEVAKVFPDLVQYDKDGKPAAVFYHLLTPILLGQLQRQQSEQEKQLAAHIKHQDALVSLQEQNQQLKNDLAGVRESNQNQQALNEKQSIENQKLVQEMASLRNQIATQNALMASFAAKFNNLKGVAQTDDGLSAVLASR